MLITIRLHNVDVTHDEQRQGPHLMAVGRMPSGQVLTQGRIFAGHSPSVQAAAVKETADWLRKYRPGWDIETLPGEGVLGCKGGDGCPIVTHTNVDATGNRTEILRLHDGSHIERAAPGDADYQRKRQRLEAIPLSDIDDAGELQPPVSIPPQDDAISQAFAKARKTIAEIETARDCWSVAQAVHYRRVA